MKKSHLNLALMISLMPCSTNVAHGSWYDCLNFSRFRDSYISDDLSARWKSLDFNTIQDGGVAAGSLILLGCYLGWHLHAWRNPKKALEHTLMNHPIPYKKTENTEVINKITIEISENAEYLKGADSEKSKKEDSDSGTEQPKSSDSEKSKKQDSDSGAEQEK